MDATAQLTRIARRLGADPELPARLAALEGGDLRALLLDVAARRAGRRQPADVLRRYVETPGLAPSPGDPQRHRELVGAAMATLPDGFEELELAPHAPLGTASVLGRFSQDRVLTTLADTEVVSDATNLLALECARRRRDPGVRRAAPTRLAASHRMLRPRDAAHFGLLALCTAGRDRGSFATELEALREHLGWHAAVLVARSPRDHLEVRLTDLSDGRRRAVLEELVMDLRDTWPALDWGFDDGRRAGRGYYREVCFAIHAVGPGGARANLSDGGFTDWTARLLADAKERLLISGLGIERLVARSADGRAG